MRKLALTLAAIAFAAGIALAADVPNVLDGNPSVVNSIVLDGANQDVKLVRDAANTLAQRNGTNAQAFRLYNTFTDTSNYERLSVDWSANVANIRSQAAGTGTTRSLVLTGGGGTATLTLANAIDSVVFSSVGGGDLVGKIAGVEALRIKSSGGIKLPYSASPVCSTNCGTTPSVTGSDSAFIVTLGTTPASGFLLTFNGTFTNPPSCMAQMALAGMVVGKQALTAVTTATTVTVVTNGTAPATGDKYAFICIGM